MDYFANGHQTLESDISLSESCFGKHLNIAGFIYSTLVGLIADKNEKILG